MSGSPEHQNQHRVLRITEVADRLNTTPAIVRRLIRDGRLKAKRYSPRNVRILESELFRFLYGSLLEPDAGDRK